MHVLKLLNSCQKPKFSVLVLLLLMMFLMCPRGWTQSRDSLDYTKQHEAAVRLIRENRLDEALEILRNVLPDSQGDPKVQADFIDVLVWKGMWEDSIRHYEAVAAKIDLPAYVLPNIGKSYRETGRYEKAIAIFRQILSQSPEDKDAFIGLAYSLFDLRRNAELQRLLEDRLKRYPDQKKWWAMLAYLYAQQEKWSAVLEAANHLSDLHPNDGDLQKSYEQRQRALDLYYDHIIEVAREGNYDLVLQIIRKLGTLGYRNKNADFDEMVILSWKGDYQETIRRYEALAARHVSVPPYALKAVAVAYRGLNQTKRAAEVESKLWISNPKKPNLDPALVRAVLHEKDPHIAYRKLMELIKQNPDDDFSQLKRIMLLSQLNKFDEALERVDDFLAKHPNHRDALFLKGDILRNLHEYVKALQVYAKIEGLGHGYHIPPNLEASLFLELGSLSLADRIINQSPEAIDPDVRSLARGDRAKYFIKWELPKQAIAVLDENIDYFHQLLMPSSVQPASLAGIEDRVCAYTHEIVTARGVGILQTPTGRHYLRSVWDLMLALRLDEQMQPIRTVYEKMIELQVEMPFWALQAAADAYLYLREPEKALEIYNQLLPDRPDSFELRMAIFYTYIELERFKEAEEMLEQVHRDEPSQKWERGLYAENWKAFDVAVNEAWLLMYQDRLREAEEVIAKLRIRGPNSTGVRNAEAHNHLWRGWYRRALEEFEMIRTLDPKLRWSNNGYALALHELGYVQEAEGLIRAMRERYPDDRYFIRSERKFKIARMRTLIVDAGSELENHGSDDYIVSVYFDQPVTEDFKIFSHAVFRWTDMSDPGDDDQTLRRLYLGGILNQGQRWTLKGAVSSDYDITDHVGFLVDGSYSPTDHWTIQGSYENRIYDLPVRSRDQGIDANEAKSSLTYRLNESFNVSLSGLHRHYSDGNNFGSYLLRTDNAVWTRAHWKVRLATEWYGSHSSKRDLPYYSPKYLYSGTVIPSLEHVWYRRYEREIRDRILLEFGLQKEEHIDLNDVWALQYEQDYQASERFMVTIGLRYAMRNYDDEDVHSLNGYISMKARF